MTTTKQKKNSKIRHLEYYDLQNTLDTLYADSGRGKIFNNLMPLIESEENIRLAYRNIKRNSGSNTSGVDRLTIKDIEKNPETKFVEVVRKKLQWYKPKAVRRVEIPKPNGKLRPLGIPAIWDRICTLFLTGNFLSNYVDGVLVPQRLPPKAAVICQRQRVITFEGKRNGGLDFLKAAV